VSTIFPEDQDDAVEQLLPEDDEPLAEDELLDDLDQSIEDFPDQDDLVVTTPEAPPLGRSWAFDYGARKFISGPQGHGPVATYGLETLRQWIEKCMRTDRGAHPIHSDEYGVEGLASGMGEPVATFPTGDYEQRLHDALLFHPRIADVRSFDWDLEDDDEGVFVSFEVVLDDDETLHVSNARLE
jgi:Protein of unknown function (DUF2634)